MCNNSLLATDYIEKIFSRKSKQTSAMKPEALKNIKKPAKSATQHLQTGIFTREFLHMYSIIQL